VRRVVILALDPAGERPIEVLERHALGLCDGREKLHAHRAKPALHLALALRRVRSCVNQRDAELGADERQDPCAATPMFTSFT